MRPFLLMGFNDYLLCHIHLWFGGYLLNSHFGALFTFIIKATFTGQWLFQGFHFSKPIKFHDFYKFFQQISRHFSLLLKWLPSSFELQSETLKSFIWIKIYHFLQKVKCPFLAYFSTYHFPAFLLKVTKFQDFSRFLWLPWLFKDFQNEWEPWPFC